MKIISLATLTALSLGSLIYSNPAQAVLLRFTGWASDEFSGKINFNLDTGSTVDSLSELPANQYPGVVSNLIYKYEEFGTGLSETYEASDGDLEIFSTGSISVEEAFELRENSNDGRLYIINFDAILTGSNYPEGTSGRTLGSVFPGVTLAFELSSSLDPSFTGITRTSEELPVDSRGLLNEIFVLGGRDFVLDVSDLDSSASIPESNYSPIILVFGLLGTGFFFQQRTKSTSPAAKQ